MKVASPWILLIGLMIAAECRHGYGEEYAIFWINRNQEGDPITRHYLGHNYLHPHFDHKSEVRRPPDSTKEWLFWDASSVSFKLGVPPNDFGSPYAVTPAIRSAIDSWDDVDPDSLSITFGGEEISRANDPVDRVNTVFWYIDESMQEAHGYTLLTAHLQGLNVGEFIDVDIALNDERHWTIGTAFCRPAGADTTYVDTVDVQSVVTHELGHALGLGHSTGENAMTISGDWCEDHKSAYEDSLGQRTVTTNDEDGYRYIYVDSLGVRATFGNDGAEKRVAARNEGDPEGTRSTRTTVFPNPFNPEVTLTFHLDQSANVSVHIYDALGQRVRVLAEEAVRPSGDYQYIWDGRDQAGRLQASGTYFLVLSLDGVQESRKLTLLH